MSSPIFRGMLRGLSVLISEQIRSSISKETGSRPADDKR